MIHARALKLTVVFLTVAGTISGAAVAAPSASSTASPNEEVEHPDGNITVLRGAGSLYAAIDTPDDLTAARDAGHVRAPQFLAPGDLLALQFESERVADTYADTKGTNSSDRFFNMLESTEMNFSILGLEYGSGQIPPKLSLNRSNVKVLHAGDTETFTVLVDTANVAVVNRRTGGQIRQTLERQLFQAILEIPTEDGMRVLAGSSQFSGLGARLETPMDGEAISGYRTPTVSESATENLRITGSTPFLPNTSLTVRAIAADGSTLLTRDVETVTANESAAGFGQTEFNTTLSLTAVHANDTFEIAVLKDGAVLRERTLLVGKQPEMYNTSARLVTSGPQEGNVAVTATVRLPEPGLLLVYVDGEPQSVTIPEHETVNRTIHVDDEAVDESGQVYPVTVWDRNENGIYDPEIDTLYTTTVDVGASVGDIELDARTRVNGWPRSTSTPTSTTQEEPNPTDDGTSGTQATTASGPGFDSLVVLFSLGLAIVLFTRHSDN